MFSLADPGDPRTGFFLIGTVVGSFLNVCIYRIPWQKSVIWPGSRCPHLFRRDRGARQHSDRELDRPAGRVPRLWCADLGAVSPGRSPGRLLVPGGLSRRRDRRAARSLGGRSPRFNWWRPPTTAVFLALAGRGHVHRLRPDDHPRPDHGHRHGRRDRAGDALAPGSARAGVVAAHHHLQGFWVGVLGLLVGVRLDPVRPQERRFLLPARGDGLRRRHPDGNDRCIPGLAGRGPHLLPRPRSSGLGHAAWKLLKYLKKWISGGQLSSCRSRTSLWALPEHGGGDSAFSLALALAGMGSGSLRHALRDILVDAGYQRRPSELTAS